LGKPWSLCPPWLRLCCLVGMPSPFNNNICAVLAFESSVVHIEFQGNRLHRRACRQVPKNHECMHFEWLSVIRRAFCSVTVHLHDTHFSTVLPPCSSVVRRCVFTTIQLHLSHTLVECETKFLNAAWQLQATIRCRLLGQRKIVTLLSAIPMATLSCLISEPCRSLTE